MPGWTSPQLGGLPHLQLSHGENSPQLSGLPGLADRATRLGGVPHLSFERDQEKKRDCMERLATPPRRGTSPSRGPPPPCEQSLNYPSNITSQKYARRLTINSVFSRDLKVSLLETSCYAYIRLLPYHTFSIARLYGIFMALEIAIN